MLRSPMMLCEAEAPFRPISSGEMSIWMKVAEEFHFGESPKWRIQFRRAPSMMITSASFKAVLLALAAFKVCESATTPFPIGVGRKGIWVLLINSLIESSALANAAPFPMTTKGALACVISLLICDNRCSSAPLLGQSGSGTASLISVEFFTTPWIRSAGRSTKPVPGLPYHEARYAFCIKSGMSSIDEGRIASLVWGVRREIASNS